MVKKEISEIKKQFNPQKSTIRKIVGCYVGAEKQQIARLDNNFLSLPEEECFKYFEILSKGLSGSLGKNLLNMDFPLESEEAGGTQEFLLRLRDSELNDPVLLDEFFEKVIEHYDYIGNYLVLVVHANYDVPKKTTDDIINEDASDEVYDFMFCTISPVELDKAALSYDEAEENFTTRERDWIVSNPAHAFLFPAFNDRSSDIHALLYYSKDAEKINQEFIDGVLGTIPTLTAKNQKESFREILEDSLEEECSYDLVRTIQENVNKIVQENKLSEEPAPVIFDKKEVMDILSESGVSDEKVSCFEKNYDDRIGEKATLQATNIVDTSKMKIKTTAVEIKCDPLQAELLETKIVDGRRCIVIPLDNGVEINGIKVIPGGIESDC